MLNCWIRFVPNFISSCSVLENVCLETCDFRKVEILDITSHSLKTLTIENNDYVKNEPKGDGLRECKLNIACPSLVSLKLGCPVVRDFSCHELKSLDKVFIHIEYVFDMLTVEDGYIMCKMLQGVAGTRELILGESFAEKFKQKPWKIPDRAITCLTYHLKKVNLVDIGHYDNHLLLVKFLLNHGHILQEMCIGWTTDYAFHMKIVKKVMESPKLSPNAELAFSELRL